MPIPTYTPGYPPDGASLGQTKVAIRNNLDGTFQTLGVDHVNNNGQPGSNPAGWHNIIHFTKQGSDPGANGFGQMYTKQITSGGNSDEVLFYESGGGRIFQLTTNPNGAGNVGSATPNGWMPLFGGMIIQWGNFTTNLVGAGTVTFPLQFPNNCFIVIAQPYGVASGAGGYNVNGFGATGFTFLSYVPVYPSGTKVNWFAIGN